MLGDSQWMLPSEIFVNGCELNIAFGSKLLNLVVDMEQILAENFDICSIEHDEQWAEIYLLVHS